MKKITLILLILINAITMKAQNNPAQTIASINPPDPDPSGIAVSSDDRVFLGFPRHADNHKEFALAELKNGQLTPFPNKEYVYLPTNRLKTGWFLLTECTSTKMIFYGFWMTEKEPESMKSRKVQPKW